MTAIGPMTPSGTPGSRGWRYRPPSPQVAAIDTPAAGAEISWTAPFDALARVTAVYVKLVTKTVAGTRHPFLQYKTASGRVLVTVAALSTVAPTTTNWWSLTIGGTSWSTRAGVQGMVLPDIVLPPGSEVQTVVTNLAATDQLETVTILYELF